MAFLEANLEPPAAVTDALAPIDEHPGPARHFNAHIAKAVHAWALGSGSQTQRHISAALEAHVRLGHPTPESWCGLFAGSRLLLACAAHPQARLDASLVAAMIDLLERARVSAPGLATVWNHLSGELLRTQGRSLAAGWRQLGVARKVAALKLDGVLSDLPQPGRIERQPRPARVHDRPPRRASVKRNKHPVIERSSKVA